MKAYKCDRCGKYYSSDEDPRVLSLKRRDGPNCLGLMSDWQDVDLCEDCFNSLKAWLIRLKTCEESYVAIGALNNILAEMDSKYGDDELADAWHAGWKDGWHNAAEYMRDRLENAMRHDHIEVMR